MFGIVLLSQLNGGYECFECNELKASLLEFRQDDAHVSTLHCVWLQHDESTLSSHLEFSLINK
jgi:hypothetical protein